MKLKITSLFIFLFISQFASAQTWQWGNLMGSISQGDQNDDEKINGLGIDTLGNTYVVGEVCKFPHFGSLISAHQGGGQQNDGFIAKYDCDGNLKWVHLIGDTYTGQSVNGIAVDKVGNCYINGHAGTGSVSQDVWFGDSLVHIPNYNGYFVAKYDSAGNLKWLKFDEFHSVYMFGNIIAINSYGLIITGGKTGYAASGTLYPGYTVSRGNWLAAFHPATGNVLWATNIDSASANGCCSFQVNTMTLDANDNIYIGGGYNSEIFVGTYVFNTGSVFATKALLVKLNSIGNIVWAKESNQVPPGSFNDVIVNMTYSNNHLYLNGSGWRNDTIFGWVDNFTGLNVQNQFIMKMDLNGNYVSAINIDTVRWAMYAYGTIAADDTGNIYLASGYNDYVRWNGFPIVDSPNSYYIPYLMKMNSNLQIQWITQANNISSSVHTRYDSFTQMQISREGDFYLGGIFTGSIFLDNNDTISYLGGNNDLFLVKYGLNNCPSSTYIDEPNSQSSFTIYPNPTSGKIIISGSTLSQLTIYNSLGEKILEAKHTNAVDLSNYSHGLYFLQVRSEKAIIGTATILKQ